MTSYERGRREKDTGCVYEAGTSVGERGADGRIRVHSEERVL